jgi:hypothetical protein
MAGMVTVAVPVIARFEGRNCCDLPKYARPGTVTVHHTKAL